MKEKHRTGKMPFPPALKLLLRGYVIMAFILLMAFSGIITHISIVIFLVTAISVSMVFGVGYLLVMSGKPVMSSSFNIPGTVLFFVKGIMVLYFISLLGQFNILPGEVVSLLMLGTAGILALAGAGSFVYEVMERSRPVPARKIAAKPRTR